MYGKSTETLSFAPTEAAAAAELPEQILLSKNQYEELQASLEKARQAVIALTQSAPQPPEKMDSPRAAAPAVIRGKGQTLTIYRLSREDRLLEKKICAGVRDPAVYRIACRLIREGGEAQEIAKKLSLSKEKIQEISDLLLGPKRKRRDEEIARAQLSSLLDELVVERQEPPAPLTYFRGYRSELVIERDQVLL